MNLVSGAMKITKTIFIIAGTILILIQFFQHSYNTSEENSAGDISVVVPVPDNVLSLMKSACYDCHSNNTIYPWYSYIQPVGWLLSNHVKEGKEELNLSEFADYFARKKHSRLKQIAETIREDEMPLTSYRYLHKDANLTPDQKELLINWAEQASLSLP